MPASTAKVVGDNVRIPTGGHVVDLTSGDRLYGTVAEVEAAQAAADAVAFTVSIVQGDLSDVSTVADDALELAETVEATVDALQNDVDAKLTGSLGATANVIPKTIGTDGKTLQASALSIDGAGVASGITFADPSAAQQPATKVWVENLLAALSAADSFKHTVRLRATGNVASLSGEQTIDGVLTAASRVLLDQQSTASQDGIYLTGAGAWTRVADLPAGAHAAGILVLVQEGTAGGDKGYLCTTDGPSDVVGTNGLAFSEFGAGGAVTESAVRTALAALTAAASFNGQALTSVGAITTTGTLALTGSMTVTGNVDGRDVSVDGTKLDGIASGAQVCSAANVQTACAALASSLSVNSQKITNLLNGAGAQDAAAFGQIPVAATAAPLAGGVAAVGSSAKWAKEDHVHPRKEALYLWGASGAPGVNADRYLLSSNAAVTTSERLSNAAALYAASVTDIQIQMNSAAAIDTMTVTLRINGSDTAVTVALTPTNTTAIATGLSVAVAANDKLTMKIRQNGTEAVTTSDIRVAVGGFYT